MLNFENNTKTVREGFTIVELLVVIVVVAILAAITVVAYGGITRQATDAALQANLTNASTKLELDKTRDGSYTTDGSTLDTGSGDAKFEYTITPDSYCLTASSNTTNSNYYLESGTRKAYEGICVGHTGTGGGEDGSEGEPIVAACPPANTESLLLPQLQYEFTSTTSTRLTLQWPGCPADTHVPTMYIFYEEPETSVMKILGTLKDGYLNTNTINEQDFCNGINIKTSWGAAATTYYYKKTDC